MTAKIQCRENILEQHGKEEQQVMWLLQILPSHDHTDKDALTMVGNCKSSTSLSGNTGFSLDTCESERKKSQEKNTEEIRELKEFPQNLIKVPREEEIHAHPTHEHAAHGGGGTAAAGAWLCCTIPKPPSRNKWVGKSSHSAASPLG